MSAEKTPAERLNDLEDDVRELKYKMAKHDSQIDDIEAAFFGTDRDPERQERLRRVGILEKLDRLDDIEAAHQETNRLLRKLVGEKVEVNKAVMTPEELANILSDMHQNAAHGEKPTMIRLFGIRYADEIRDCGESVAKIVRLSSVGDSYNAEVSKGIQLARYVIARSM